jgi:cell wall assembly regulator SMI1
VGAREDVLDLLRDPRVWFYDEVRPITGASASDLASFEERTGIVIPPAIRDWLSLCNGAWVGAGGAFGVAPQPHEGLDMESVYASWSDWAMKGWIPLGDDQTGDYYMAGTAQSIEPEGVVFFLDTHQSFEEPWFVVASDVWHFMKGYLSDERGDDWWPFDRDAVVASDPEILRYSSLVLPWERDEQR